MLAKKELRLPPDFCDDNRKRTDWLKEKIQGGLIWVMRDQYGLVGVMILEPRLDFLWLRYMAVAQRMRGERVIGSALVQKAKTLDCRLGLKAEATSRHSRRLLEESGFEVGPECSRSGHPILVWSRSWGGADGTPE
jgi:hypothetical protein